jgi:hypothetical protein
MNSNTLNKLNKNILPTDMPVTIVLSALINIKLIFIFFEV